MNFRSIILILIFLMIGACYDSPFVSIRVPGEYKGAVDPLLDMQSQPQQQEALKQRFLLVQTDR